MRKAARFLIGLMAAGFFAPLLQAQPHRLSGHSYVEQVHYATQRQRRNRRQRFQRRQVRRNRLRHDQILRHRRQLRQRRSRRGIRFDLRRQRHHPRSGFSFHFGYRDY